MGMEGLSRLWECGKIKIENIRAEELPLVFSLVRKYRSPPMDLADATLVVIADRLHTRTIFTADSDFRVYRLAGNKAFTLIP